MPLKNILVALDGSAPSQGALRAAIAMHQAYGTHLTGFIPRAEAMGPEASENNWIPAAILSTIRQTQTDMAARIEADFTKAVAGLDQARTHLVRNSASSIAEASRFFDATLVGIPERGARRSALQPDRIALLSGRPVIAFPAGIDTSRVAGRVMVAWDGSRAAARALSSATRLLETKEHVTIVTIGDPPAAARAGDGLDPRTSLERQGLSADWVAIPPGAGGIAATLLAQAEKLGAELMVMGAYEHSKFREDLFGGVTHDVMSHTPIPVFLAH